MQRRMSMLVGFDVDIGARRDQSLADWDMLVVDRLVQCRESIKIRVGLDNPSHTFRKLDSVERIDNRGIP